MSDSCKALGEGSRTLQAPTRTVPTHLPSGSPLGQQVAVSRKSLIVWAALALTFSLILAGPSGGQAEDRSTVALEVRGERLTLRAEDAPLAVILQRLAKAAGFVVYFKQPVEERVSADLADVDLEEELQRLLNHWNTMFLYDKDRRAPAAVYVFGPRGGTVAPGISERAEGPLSASEPVGDDEIDIEAHQLGRKSWQAFRFVVRRAGFDHEVIALDVTQVTHRRHECPHERPLWDEGPTYQIANANGPSRLLCLASERRENEADSENDCDRKPDPPHGHPGGGWLAGFYFSFSSR